ncbi:conserved membrane hypothetical protein [Flavobacterium sp. 9AF]|uniref:DUF423 domain-containing protein n=1 Tax=Flavobacterium sp. 9AF TaxID=2653142 RepID=UPI0012F3C422|nr:DUF423 domain-containing protein [Flavobacterium sp. 9AF]VXB25749.1 conserved membrane hypothetical protein [Flavobacterium sp. 9AF]
MEKKIILTALLLGTIAIILGAFGAHGLKKVLTVDQLNTFEVGVRYQIYHALFLLFLANSSILTLKEKGVIFYLVIIGITLFSGSIYVLATLALTTIKTKLIGPLTPIGGLLLIVSWMYMFYCVFAKK